MTKLVWRTYGAVLVWDVRPRPSWRATRRRRSPNGCLAKDTERQTWRPATARPTLRMSAALRRTDWRDDFDAPRRCTRTSDALSATRTSRPRQRTRPRPKWTSDGAQA